MEMVRITLILCGFIIGSGLSEATHNVMEFGAVGDGNKDDTQAFKDAWAAVCGESSSPSRLIVPKKKTFLLYPIAFDGPCKSPLIVVYILGTIIAPEATSVWQTNPEYWISFHQINGLTVSGYGLGQIDGRGQKWWAREGDTNKPTALHFTNCQNLKVNGLNNRDSQRNHITVNDCQGATLSNLHITAPESSPNTDGINVVGSTNVLIRDSFIGTGDDCVAVGGGSSFVNVTRVNCGPGHGISIGSLGRNGVHDAVEHVHVQSCNFTRTMNGIRIKTCQGGKGYARRITFTDITLSNSNNPIIIDQYYCPNGDCSEFASAVQVSDVTYSGVHGTSIAPVAISLKCSKSVSCTNILLSDVKITSASGGSTSAQCINAHGRYARTNPAVDCLLKSI